MKPKTLLLLALALGCGLVASIGISQVMDQNSRGPSVATAPIYVALTNINVNDPIDAGMVSLQEWPKDKIPAGAITQLDELEGRRPRTSIFAGETILEGKLLGDDEYADPIGQLPAGYRLSTISVDAEKSAAGLLSPGDRVDVQLFVSRDERNSINMATTKIILQNIRVYAVEQAVQRAADGGEARTIPKTVSLVVLPEQAARIDLAQNLGELSLIPRSPNDENTVSTVSVSVEDLLGGKSDKNSRDKEQGQGPERQEDKPADSGFFDKIGAVEEVDPPFEMEIVRAEEVSVMEFDADSGKPIRPAPEGEDGSGSRGGSSGGSADSGSGSRDSGESVDDFPIDFDE